MKTISFVVFMAFVTALFSACQKDEVISNVNQDVYDTHVGQLKNGGIDVALIEALIQKIEDYVTNGDLEPGIGNALISKLENAKKSLEKGNSTAADNQLEAVINQLEDLIGNGTIDVSIGGYLLSETQEITGEEWQCGQPFHDERLGGRYYKSVQIGTQCWMAENLAWLPQVNDPDFSSLSVRMYYVYDYYGTDVSAAKSTVNYAAYGVLYNWPAAMNNDAASSENPSGVQGACPEGWHLPSMAEWEVLNTFLEPDAGFKMKSTTGWDLEGNGDNSSGFNGLPGGVISFQGVLLGFIAQNRNVQFWTTDNYSLDNDYAWERGLSYMGSTLNQFLDYKDTGLSVRCIKN